MPPREKDFSFGQGVDNAFGALADVFKFQLGRGIAEQRRQQALQQIADEREFQTNRDEANRRFQGEVERRAAIRRAEELRLNRALERDLNQENIASREKIAGMQARVASQRADEQRRDESLRIYDGILRSLDNELHTLLSNDIDPDLERIAEIRRRKEVLADVVARFRAQRDPSFIPVDFSIPNEATALDTIAQKLDLQRRQKEVAGTVPARQRGLLGVAGSLDELLRTLRPIPAVDVLLNTAGAREETDRRRREELDNLTGNRP